MIDQSFFENKGPFTLREIAGACEAVLADEKFADIQVKSVAALSGAGPDELSFLDNIKYKSDFMSSKAGACIVSEKMREFAPSGMAVLISQNPYKSYALAATLFFPDSVSSAYYGGYKCGKSDGNVAPSAVIDPSAKIGEGCFIGPNVVIEAGVQLGKGTRVEAGSIICASVQLGDACHIGSNCNLSHCIVGNAVRVHNGSCIGQDGFGFALDPAGFVPVPQLGRVIIGDHVNIGANTTIDRGSSGDTVIGRGSIIDNLVQIGHNVQIGDGCVVVAQVGISGSTKVGSYSMLGGQAGVAGHIEIGSGVRIGAQSGISKSIPDGMEVMGTPAQEKRAHWKELATLKRLTRKQAGK